MMLNQCWATTLLALSVLAVLVTAAAAADNSNLRLDGGNEFGWDEDQWFVQVDGVMGGRSSGFLDFDNDGANEDSTLTFSGEISLRGGGFSSVRKFFPSDNVQDLTGYAGIVVELETTEAYDEGASSSSQVPLGLHLQLHDQASRFGYASAFAVPLATVEGQETSVFLPLESFDRASRSGFRCRQSRDCTFDPSTVNELDIYVLYQEGPFEVRVKSITAVEDAVSFPSPVISLSSADEVAQLVAATIGSGGSLYDYGYGELCVASYRSTLNTILAATGDGVTQTVRGMACEGLDRAAGITIDTTTSNNNKVADVAWALRGTLDAIMEELAGLDAGGSNPDNWRPSGGGDWATQCVGVTSFPAVNVRDSNSTLSLGSSTRSIPTSGAAEERIGLVLVTSLTALLLLFLL